MGGKNLVNTLKFTVSQDSQYKMCDTVNLNNHIFSVPPTATSTLSHNRNLKYQPSEGTVTSSQTACDEPEQNSYPEQNRQ